MGNAHTTDLNADAGQEPALGKPGPATRYFKPLASNYGTRIISNSLRFK
jgi:hypothetical protein